MVSKKQWKSVSFGTQLKALRVSFLLLKQQENIVIFSGQSLHEVHTSQDSVLTVTTYNITT